MIRVPLASETTRTGKVEWFTRYSGVEGAFADGELPEDGNVQNLHMFRPREDEP